MVDIHAWSKSRTDELLDLREEISFVDLDRIILLGQQIVKAFKSGNKLAFLGNGGSAAEASHLATEFVSKCTVEHPPLNAICLNDSQSSITAIGNDYGFDFIFERLVRAHLREGDVLIALSTSGRSSNVLRALNSASKLGVMVVLWTGINKPDLSDVEVWNCRLRQTPRIQEVHLLWGHLLSEFVEIHFSN
jgi:D-sedoheptulose 7-phosphate isomerase